MPPARRRHYRPASPPHPEHRRRRQQIGDGHGELAPRRVQQTYNQQATGERTEVADQEEPRNLGTGDMRRVHHSWHPQETNSNFGFNLSWWDRLFGQGGTRFAMPTRAP